MLTKDDQDWLALLEGKEVPDADPNTLEEVRALKTALHTELQWQKLQRRIQADKAKKLEPQPKPKTQSQVTEWLEKWVWEPISGWLHWKPLVLGTAYTVVVVVVTLKIGHFFPVQHGTWSPKSSIPASNNNCSSNPFLRSEVEAEQEALRMKQLFESAGVTEVSYQKINNTAFYLEIVPPDNISQELRNLWDEENINTKLSQDCSVGFIFIAPEE